MVYPQQSLHVEFSKEITMSYSYSLCIAFGLLMNICYNIFERITFNLVCNYL